MGGTRSEVSLAKHKQPSAMDVSNPLGQKEQSRKMISQKSFFSFLLRKNKKEKIDKKYRGPLHGTKSWV